MESDLEIEKATWETLKSLVSQEVTPLSLAGSPRHHEDVREESRLRFNAIVEALVVKVEWSLDGDGHVLVEAVYWPDHDEWEIEDLTIHQPASGTDS